MGSLSCRTLCLTTPGSLAGFSTSLANHGTEEIKPINSFMFGGMVRTEHPVASAARAYPPGICHVAGI